MHSVITSVTFLVGTNKPTELTSTNMPEPLLPDSQPTNSTNIPQPQCLIPTERVSIALELTVVNEFAYAFYAYPT